MALVLICKDHTRFWCSERSGSHSSQSLLKLLSKYDSILNRKFSTRSSVLAEHSSNQHEQVNKMPHDASGCFIPNRLFIPVSASESVSKHISMYSYSVIWNWFIYVTASFLYMVTNLVLTFWPIEGSIAGFVTKGFSIMLQKKKKKWGRRMWARYQFKLGSCLEPAWFHQYLHLL